MLGELRDGFEGDALACALSVCVHRIPLLLIIILTFINCYMFKCFKLN